ncbi:hypothetical protein BBP40_001317 [Aspergillus hancockii]|nr:hypothetical protein BBP40_001317 [Aspergillus hancockii]
MYPHPVLVPNVFFTDKEAAFPSRMRLERHEELLQLLNWCCEENIAPVFEGHQGNWRPALLLPANEVDRFQVCEINAQFPSNGIDLTVRMCKVLKREDTKTPWLDVPDGPEHMLGRHFSIFNPTLPIHHVRRREQTQLIESFFRFAEERTGMRPRVVDPNDLRLVRDDTSPTGYTLHWHQLFRDEFASLSPDIQQHLALSSVQDFRSTLLIHDKRILGILHQELDSLTTKHRVLTEKQADLLRKGKELKVSLGDIFTSICVLKLVVNLYVDDPPPESVTDGSLPRHQEAQTGNASGYAVIIVVPTFYPTLIFWSSRRNIPEKRQCFRLSIMVVSKEHTRRNHWNSASDIMTVW